MSNEARGLIVSRNPVCRETFLSFKAYVSENVQNGHCNKKRKQIRVLADALTPDARKLLAENIKEENAEVRFYRTCKPHEGCSARFTTFQLQPHIKIDDLKSSFVPRPPKGDAATRARNINEAAFVAQELKPFSKAEPVKKSSEMYHVLDSMLKLQQLTTITADTPFESFEAVQQIVASSTEPYFSYTEFIEAVQKIPFRAVNHSFTLPYISTYKSKDKLNCEWERVYMLFEEEGVSRDIVCTALKASLQKDALSLLRYVMTGIAVRAVPVHISELQILRKSFSDVAKVEGDKQQYSTELRHFVNKASASNSHPCDSLFELFHATCPHLSVELSSISSAYCYSTFILYHLTTGYKAYGRQNSRIGRCEQLMHKASVLAFADAGISEKDIDVDLIVTIPHLHQLLFPPTVPHLYSNPPRSLGNLLKTHTATRNNAYYATSTGGNGPQYAINEMGDRIAKGEVNSVLVAGSEAMATLAKARAKGWGIEGVKVPMFSMTGERKEVAQSGKKLPWGDHPGGEPKLLTPEKSMFGLPEIVHGLAPAAHMYPLIEQAFKRKYYKDVPGEQYQAELSKLMSEMSAVAAKHPEHSWFPTYKTPEEIGTVTNKNRMIGFPYTKMMNSVIDVNQSAAVLMMSIDEARRRGIPEEKCIFIHARCAVSETPIPTLERSELHTSNGMKVMKMRLESALGMSLNNVQHKEIYSCFPIAVKMAVKELGITYKDAGELTQIGNMQFHGGPGNNFGLHGVVEMVNLLRKKREDQGLVTMNGGYFSKHSGAVYSAQYRQWAASTMAEDQQLCNSYAKPVKLDMKPNGRGMLEFWTVAFGRQGPQRAIGVGTLESGKRFVANSADPNTMEYLLKNECFDVPVQVTAQQGRGPIVFTLDNTPSRL